MPASGLPKDPESLPFYWAGALMQSAPRSVTEVAGKTRPVIILRSASQRLALHVDEVLGSREVVVKNPGLQLSRSAGVAGMSVLASGAVVLDLQPRGLWPRCIASKSARLCCSARGAGCGAWWRTSRVPALSAPASVAQL